ncbi:MAG: gliding motility-associated C-terminal domain-containing protein [Ekhidna sp.]
MHRWKYIFFLTILPFLAEAQIFSSKGRFSVEFDRGCNPMTVNISEHDSFGVVTRQYYYFDGAGITNNLSFSYQDPGTYQIVQVVGVDGIADKTDTLFVEVLASRKPEIQIQKCNGLQLSVTSRDSYYDSIRVYFTMTDSATLLLNETAEHTYVSNQNQVIESKGFFNNAEEICTSFFEDITPLPSLQVPAISNAFIKETCKDQFSLYLELNAIDTLTNYRINLIQGNTSQLFAGFLSQRSLVLTGIPFSREDYCINIEAYDPCNGSSSFSTDFCQISSSLSLSPFQSLYSSYSSAGIFINLDTVNVGSFIVYRRIEGEAFELLSEQPGSFTDAIGSRGRKYFYKIDYLDSCNQILYSAETNPPLVDATEESPNQYMVQFTPPINSLVDTPENEYQTGNDFSRTQSTIPASQFSLQLDAKDGSPRQFITATSTYPDGTVLNSNAFTVRYELIIYVPTAFTPNGDGLNDTLELFGLPTLIATTNIYSRWGQLVYSSEQPTPGWDGTINGTVAAQGTYLYEIIFETADGEKRTQKGTFALIKK